MIPISRPFAGEADFEPYVELLKAMIEVDKGDLTLSREDIQFEWIDEEEGWVRDLGVWEMDGALVAAYGAWRELADEIPRAYGEIATHPDWREPVFVDEVVQASRAAVSGLVEEPVEHRLGASETQQWLVDGLVRNGYALDRIYFRMIAEIPERGADVSLPDGFVIRPLAGDAEVEQWVETFNGAFATHHDPPTSSPAEKRHRMSEPSYSPATDLVLIGPDGNFAGVSLCTLEPVEGEGPRAWVRSIGILPENRGTGLGKALLQQSLNVLHDVGYRTVRLSVDADNATSALRIYEGAGFSVEYRRLVFMGIVQPLA
jgi:mycothiol synthase